MAEEVFMHYFLSLPEKASAEPTLLFLGSHNFLRQIPTPPPRILHSHADTVEFLYFRDGKGVCTVDGKKYAVKKGDMVIYNANTLHLDNFGLVYFCGATNIQISGFPPNVILAPEISPVFHLGCHENTFHHLLAAMNEIAAANTDTAQESCQLLFRSFFNQILYLIEAKHVLDRNPPINKHTSQTTGEKILDYVNQHILDRLSLQEVAAHFRLSASYVSRIFKQTTGCTLSAYQTRGRIGHAQTLLLTTDMSLAEIAKSLGYATQGHLSRQFMEIVKIKPSSYRKQFGGRQVGKNISREHP
jgi:AraC-like DNA-binding protein